MAQFKRFSSNIVYSGMTEVPVPANKNNTDVIAPEVALYIEGVQVPFISIYISQVYQQLPTASIQIPPASGLMDILRGYQPKVHIFYRDDNYGGMRLLFWGHATSTNYARSRGVGASSSITFNCVHKNELMKQFTLDFINWANPVAEGLADPAIASMGGGVRMSSLNSVSSVIEALSGIDGVAEQSERFINENVANLEKLPLNKADTELEKIVKRLYGMPGMAINLWNQVKRSGLNTENTNLALTNMWAPLVEDGISFFKRISGHPTLEAKLQGSRQAYCHKGTTKETEVLVAPYFRTPMMSAVQSELAVKNIQQVMTFAGELTSYLNLVQSVYETSQYDQITLSSPAEVSADPLLNADRPWEGGVELCAVETIIKPKLPFYYSPICNVLLPRMYTSVQISQDDAAVPSRVTATYTGIPGMQGANISFRGPSSIREAVAYNVLLKSGAETALLSLSNTFGFSYAIPGKYEQGNGIRPARINLPWWLSQVIGEKAGAGGIQEEIPQKGTVDYRSMMFLATDWTTRYGTNIVMDDGSIRRTESPNKKGMNVYSPSVTDVRPFARLMLSSVDYEYSSQFAGSRVGTIEAIFNPYIIPGYPMEVIDDSPNHPSFHGFCTSVSHTITSRSISTNIGIAAAMTYAEISNYYIPPMPPFLMTALDLINGDEDIDKVNAGSIGDQTPYTNVVSTLLQNPKAKLAADTFYSEVLGVGAVAPDDLIHFTSGRAYPMERKGQTLSSRYAGGNVPNLNHNHNYVTGRETEDYYSSVGNLRMISRPIESMASIKSKFALSFIDLNPSLYNTSQVNYLNPILAANMYLEPGASMFLDYMETDEFISTKI